MGYSERRERDRKTYLGGHDISAILNMSKYSSPIKVYVQKKEGLTEGESDAIFYGKLYEAPVIEAWKRKTGHLCEPGRLIEHPKYPFLAGTPDGFCLDDPLLMVEAKTAGGIMLKMVDADGFPLWGHEGTDQIPVNYLLQTQYYMGLSGRKRTDLAVLFFDTSREFRIYRINFDEELYEKIIKRAVEFWENHIIPGIEPPIDEMPDDSVLGWMLKKAKSGGNVVQMDSELKKMALKWNDYNNDIKRLEKGRDAIKLPILLYMKDNGIIKLSGKDRDRNFSIQVQGGGEGKEYIAWQSVAESLASRLGLPMVPPDLIASNTQRGNPISPYARGYFNSLNKKEKENE